MSNLFKSPAYLFQTQLQMVCAQSNYFFLESCPNPEPKSVKYFLIEKNNILWDIVKCLMHSIFSNTAISDSPHKEYKLFANENLSQVSFFDIVFEDFHFLVANNTLF